MSEIGNWLLNKLVGDPSNAIVGAANILADERELALKLANDQEYEKVFLVWPKTNAVEDRWLRKLYAKIKAKEKRPELMLVDELIATVAKEKGWETNDEEKFSELLRLSNGLVWMAREKTIYLATHNMGGHRDIYEQMLKKGIPSLLNLEITDATQSEPTNWAYQVLMRRFKGELSFRDDQYGMRRELQFE